MACTRQVVLPEGASLLEASLPFPVERAQEKKFTYLDTAGRPVLVLHKANVVPDHNAPLAVTYRFSSIYLLQVGGACPCGCLSPACTLTGNSSLRGFEIRAGEAVLLGPGRCAGCKAARHA